MNNLGARGGAIITRADKRRPVADDTTKRVRLDDPDMRREVVLTAAIKVASEGSLLDMTWPKVAAACEVKTSVITARRTFGNLVELRRAVAERGRSKGDQKIIEEATRFGILN